jgi:diketogulonate reductase-like aldo/keto reductase
VYQVPTEQAVPVIHEAIDAGYRLIDTAAMYQNERGVGEAVRSAPVAREELFVTTKVWNDRHGFDEARRAFDESMDRLGLDYVDLYLIHWPMPELGLYAETWRALIRLREEGRAKSIGVSNFSIEQLERIVDETGVVPVVNQIELHPGHPQRAMREYHARHGIVTESWSPIARGEILRHESITQLAGKYGKTPAQIVLRWHVENGLVAIPKSSNPARIRENIDVFDFRLDADDMSQIDRLATEE